MSEVKKSNPWLKFLAELRKDKPRISLAEASKMYRAATGSGLRTLKVHRAHGNKKLGSMSINRKDEKVHRKSKPPVINMDIMNKLRREQSESRKRDQSAEVLEKLVDKLAEKKKGGCIPRPRLADEDEYVALPARALRRAVESEYVPLPARALRRAEENEYLPLHLIPRLEDVEAGVSEMPEIIEPEESEYCAEGGSLLNLSGIAPPKNLVKQPWYTTLYDSLIGNGLEADDNAEWRNYVQKLHDDFVSGIAKNWKPAGVEGMVFDKMTQKLTGGKMRKFEKLGQAVRSRIKRRAKTSKAKGGAIDWKSIITTVADIASVVPIPEVSVPAMLVGQLVRKL